MINEKKYDLKVGWVSGDDLLDRWEELMKIGLKHLDGENGKVVLKKETIGFLGRPGEQKVVVANAYLGARAITRGLKEGCDIIICMC